MIIKNVNIITRSEILNNYCIEINDGTITNIAKDINADNYIDGLGRFLSPGFVDMHIHGGGGYDFLDENDETYKKITYAHMIHGTTSMVPTLVASSIDDLEKAIVKYKNAKDYTCNLLGLHLEGPYLNKEQCGAINIECLHDPNIEEAKELIELANGAIARITLAPELANSNELIKLLRENNITISIGHSNATLDIVKNAYNNGANLITHFYSACSSITRRNGYRVLGIIEAGYLIDDLDIEIIADGSHLPIDLLKYICKFKNHEHISLITDAMRAAGTNLKETYLGKTGEGTECIIEDGVAKLKDRSAFAGSIATCDLLVKNMLEAGIELNDAINMVTINPIKALGSKFKKGEIKVGNDADIVLFDEKVDISLVIINGEITYKK